jgi:hypothetical protein
MISLVPNKQELSLPMRAADLPAETLTAVICRYVLPLSLFVGRSQLRSFLFPVARLIFAEL